MVESEKEQTQNMKGILIMRHGERIDDTKLTQLLSEYDPELTPKGINQAKDIGKQLKKCLKKEIKLINLYTSPFTRTIMTGLNVINQINENRKSNILLIKGLSEMYTENNFKYNPFDTLLINNK